MNRLVTRGGIVVAALALVAPARAQAPDVERATYTNSCYSQASGDTQGDGLLLTKSEGGYGFIFLNYWSVPRPPVPAKGRIVGEKISFEVEIDGLPVRFTGTITPAEIKGRFTNDRNVAYYNSEVRWERLLPNAKRPYCR